MQEVYEMLKKAGAYFLATCEDAQPRVRPFGTVNLYKDRLYIQTGKSKAVSRQLHVNPKLALWQITDVSVACRDRIILPQELLYCLHLRR